MLAVEKTFHLVTEASGLQAALDELKGSEAIAIDTETAFPRDPVKAAAFNNPYNKTKSGDYGPFDPHTAEVRLVQMRGENTKPVVVDLWALQEQELKDLANFLGNYAGTFLLANAKFDAKMIFSNLGVWIDQSARIFDVIQASIMIGNSVGMGQVRGHKLKDISRELLGLDLDKTDQSSDWSVPELTSSQLEYAAADVEHLHTLTAKLTKALVDMGQAEPTDLEMRVICPTARMEFEGVPFDLEVYRKVQEAARVSLPRLLSKVARAFKDRLGAKILRSRHRTELMDGTEYFETVDLPYWGGKAGKSLMQARPKVLEMLQSLGLTDEEGEPIDNTRRSDLEAYVVEHPEVGFLLEYSALSKQAQFDYDNWRHPITGRIHPTFNISGASTGRFSSTKPNMQQVPSKYNMYHPDGSKMNYRYCFRSQHKNRLVISCDFSGQELAVMAALSGDPIMIRTLNEGGDIHSESAAGMYGIEASEARQPIPGLTGITYRDRGKQFTFSIAYGKTPEGFAKMWKMTLDEVKKLIESFRGRFKGLTAMLDAAGNGAELQQFVQLPNGAMRFLGGEGESNGARNGRRRAGGNMMIQGSSSWMTRLAMIELDRRAREEGLAIWMVASIHDELLSEIGYDETCAYGRYWADEDPTATAIKGALSVAKKAKDSDALKSAQGQLEAHELALAQSCEVNCVGKDCALRNRVVAGDVMQWAGEQILQGIVPAGYSAAVAKYWEH